MKDTYTAKLDPRRDAVADIMATAIEHYRDENPGQLFADMVMATSIMAEYFEADVSNIQEIFDAAKDNAVNAASFLEDQWRVE